MLLLTSGGEFRVTPINSDAITPTSISIRSQSYIGAGFAQPVIVNQAAVFAAARGGHLREIGFSAQAQSYVTGDISLRASHLFDGQTIRCLSYEKAPVPIVWSVSDSGYMPAITYVPEEGIGGWHWHDTDGTIESMTVVTESGDDAVYVAVLRTVNGSEVRYIERMHEAGAASIEDAFHVDSGITYDGRYTDTATIQVTGGNTWTHVDSLTLTCSIAVFRLGDSDVGDKVILRAADGTICTITIASVTDGFTAVGNTDVQLPADLRNTELSSWEFAKSSFRIPHLEGATVSVLADGVASEETVTSSVITLDAPASVVHAGLQYTSEVQTLPSAFDATGFGQGVKKAVARVSARVRNTATFYAGDSDVGARIVGSPNLSTSVREIYPGTKWTDGAQLYIKQDDPLPLNLIGLAIEIAVGDP
jgi:hypothetical protein